MTRTKTRHILLLVALLHLVADVAFAGGAVLCVGPDDHRALETEHLGGCDEPAFERDVAQLDSLQEECDDTEVHSDPELVSENDQASKVPAPLLALVSSPPRHTVAESPVLSAFQRSPGLPPGLSALRTTVLIL